MWSERAQDKSARISVDDLTVSIARVTGVMGAGAVIPLDPEAARVFPGQVAIMKALDLPAPK